MSQTPQPIKQSFTKEEIANIVYQAMRFDRPQPTPGWDPYGNSNAQERAREAAREILELLPALSYPSDEELEQLEEECEEQVYRMDSPRYPLKRLNLRKFADLLLQRHGNPQPRPQEQGAT
jgi:hypothetical protein